MMCSALRASVAVFFRGMDGAPGIMRESSDDHFKDLLEILFFCA